MNLQERIESVQTKQVFLKHSFTTPISAATSVVITTQMLSRDGKGGGNLLVRLNHRPNSKLSLEVRRSLSHLPIIADRRTMIDWNHAPSSTFHLLQDDLLARFRHIPHLQRSRPEPSWTAAPQRDYRETHHGEQHRDLHSSHRTVFDLLLGSIIAGRSHLVDDLARTHQLAWILAGCDDRCRGWTIECRLRENGAGRSQSEGGRLAELGGSLEYVSERGEAVNGEHESSSRSRMRDERIARR